MTIAIIRSLKRSLSISCYEVAAAQRNSRIGSSCVKNRCYPRYAAIGRRAARSVLAVLLLASTAQAQLLQEEWELENGYDDDMLFLHALVNYSQDVYWQLEWERRLLKDNAVQLNSGSVAAAELLTSVDLNINQDLNDKWRFQGGAFRHESKHRPGRQEDIFLGLERSILQSSSLFFMATPQYDKEFIDLFAGYTFYRDERQQYVRAGVLLEDITYASKNDLEGKYEQEPVALQWAVRLGADDWWIFSQGRVGTGFERVFPDADASPELLRHDQQENFALLKFTKVQGSDIAWSAWIDWYEFNETKLFRQQGVDYEYLNSQLSFAGEYVRTLRDKHRFRVVAHYVRQEASSRGFNAHEYDRTDVLAGLFYERLWTSNRLMLAYVFGQPDAEFLPEDQSRAFTLDDYRDKIIVGWRYTFSADAQVLISLSHEVAAMGFGGGNVQFQMFF